MIDLKHLFLLFVLVLFVACSGESSPESKVETKKPVATAAAKPANPVTVPSAAHPTVVPHFYCPSSCVNGVGDAKGKCPVCGLEMIHNQDYHNQPQQGVAQEVAQVQEQPQFQAQPTGKPGESKIELPMTQVSQRLASGRSLEDVTQEMDDQMRAQAAAAGRTPAIQQAPAGLPPGLQQGMPPTNEPPQNADGVWHFTCPNGCSGGAGAQQACGSCGATLAHNSAYH